MMRRIVLLVTVALIMAAMMVATAMPLFADAPPNAHNCLGAGLSSATPESSSHGQTGFRTKSNSQTGTLGEQVSAGATGSGNCGNNR
jgi:hypothetical protein